MTTAGDIIVGALAFVRADASGAVPVLVATIRLRGALAPRVGGAVEVLDDRALAIIAGAPTAWCAAALRLGSPFPHAECLARVPGVFPQLRSVALAGDCCVAHSAVGAMFAALNVRTIRHVHLGGATIATGRILEGLRHIAPVLETLIIGNGGAVNLDSLSHLNGLTRLRVFSIGWCGALTDAALAAMIADAPGLESLYVEGAHKVEGAFLDQLHDACSVSMRDLSLGHCVALSDAGVKRLDRFQSLTRLRVVWCRAATQPPFDGLTRLPPRLSTLDLQHCAFAGHVSLSMFPATLTRIDLSSNRFSGPLMFDKLPVSAIHVDFGYNAFSATNVDLSNLPEQIVWLSIASNAFDGTLSLSNLPPTLVELYVRGRNRFDKHPRPPSQLIKTDLPII